MKIESDIASVAAPRAKESPEEIDVEAFAALLLAITLPEAEPSPGQLEPLGQLTQNPAEAVQAQSTALSAISGDAPEAAVAPKLDLSPHPFVALTPDAGSGAKPELLPHLNVTPAPQAGSASEAGPTTDPDTIPAPDSAPDTIPAPAPVPEKQTYGPAASELPPVLFEETLEGDGPGLGDSHDLRDLPDLPASASESDTALELAESTELRQPSERASSSPAQVDRMRASRLLERVEPVAPSADVKILRTEGEAQWLELRHPELGAIRLQMQMRQAALDVRAVAQSVASAVAIRKSEDTLRESVARHGVELRMRVGIDQPDRKTRPRARRGATSLEVEA